MAERPAPLMLVVDPAAATSRAPFGGYEAVAETGRALLAAELSQRLGAMGAAVAPLLPEEGGEARAFHWGRWFAAASRAAVAASGGRIDAIGYAGAGSLALVDDATLDQRLSPVPGEVVSNNRFSTDAFVVAGDLGRAISALEAAETDNAAARHLENAGFGARDLASTAWSRFDVDTPLDLALLRLATRLPGTRRPDRSVTGLLEMGALPGGRRLELPRLADLGAVMRDGNAELLVAGRIPSATGSYLETETACRVRAVVEERGMRSARGGRPRSLLADWLRDRGPSDLVRELSSLADAVILDTRVLMAAQAGSADSAGWPPAEERFASDFHDAGRVATAWLAELTAAAASASVPVLLGGHALVSDGLRILVEAAWLGR
ncbi:MAG TPA: hypothetical protein VK838_03730 [Candidatus Limnocylindrales bacterium]|nr:hypothetical protein [Candidatus Limnocylindrales bacterium]